MPETKEKKCECCELKVKYDTKGMAIVEPGSTVRATGLQMAVFQRDVSRLPLACRSQQCAGKCAGELVIAELGPKKR